MNLLESALLGNDQEPLDPQAALTRFAFGMETAVHHLRREGKLLRVLSVIVEKPHAVFYSQLELLAQHTGFTIHKGEAYISDGRALQVIRALNTLPPL